MAYCELEHARYSKIETFLKNGDLEIDFLQSFNPLMMNILNKKKIKKSKWNRYKLQDNLTDIVSKMPGEYRGITIDSKGNCTEKDFFIKCTPIIDPIGICQNEYTNFNHHHWLAEVDNSKVISLYNKVNNPNNSAYIDTLCSVILSKLKAESPHFAAVYSVYTGIISEYEEDITEELDSLRNTKWFSKCIKSGKYMIKKIPIESISSNSKKKNLKNSKTNIQGTELCDMNQFAEKINHTIIPHHEEDHKYTLIHPKVPVQIVCMEKFENTFELLIKNTIKRVKLQTRFKRLIKIRKNIVIHKLKSWIFQICAGLSCANEKYDFVHNDLHIQNVMGCKTNKQFVYYLQNDIMYKIPTYGYIMKIIDFGRSTFTLNNCSYIGDVFSLEGEAGGQYYHSTIKDKHSVLPNPAFDLARFACSFIEDLEENEWPNQKNLEEYDIGRLINKWTLDDNGNSLMDIDGFSLYVCIAKNFRKKVPKSEIKENAFSTFKIEKKLFDDTIIIPS